jgi:hypothetical protein
MVLLGVAARKSGSGDILPVKSAQHLWSDGATPWTLERRRVKPSRLKPARLLRLFLSIWALESSTRKTTTMSKGKSQYSPVNQQNSTEISDMFSADVGVVF